MPKQFFSLSRFRPQGESVSTWKFTLSRFPIGAFVGMTGTAAACC
jgi:hypothetical protein